MKQQTKRKLKKQAISLTKELLTMLVKFPAGITEVFIMSDPNYRRYFYNQETSSRQVKRAMINLSRQRLVKMREYKGKLKYEITNLGRAKNLRWNYRQLPKIARKDGLATIVIFDIPETRRKVRDFLRRFLKENEFIQLQKSVFIGRFYLGPEFKEVIKELKLELCVSILEGRVIR